LYLFFGKDVHLPIWHEAVKIKTERTQGLSRSSLGTTTDSASRRRALRFWGCWWGW
jgi:hypothetical protein